MTGNWFGCGAYCWRNEAGYRIAAFRVCGGWRYSLFAPPVTEREFDGRLKARYAKGERVPQVREHLGCFNEPESARAAAARHAQINQPAQGGDHGNADSDQRQSETESANGASVPRAPRLDPIDESATRAGEQHGGEVEAAA